MNGTLVFCSAANETYILGLAVTVCSALECLSPSFRAPVAYILDGGISERSWSKFEKSVRNTRSDCVLRRLHPELGAFAGLPHDWGSSVMAYARLALPAMVSDARILYLDSDLIVQSDLGELWNTDLGDCIMAAAPDLTAKDLGHAKLPLAELGLSAVAPCLNSGVLLIDLERWRQADVSAEALGYLHRWPDYASNWDQSALNAILCGRWQSLDVEWNTPAWLADLGRDGCRLDSAVLHFVGPHKPWLYGYHTNASAKVFYRWVDRTAWRGWRPTKVRQACKWAKYRIWKLRNRMRLCITVC